MERKKWTALNINQKTHAALLQTSNSTWGVKFHNYMKITNQLLNYKNIMTL